MLHSGNIVTYNGQQYMLRPDNWLDESYKNSLRQEYNLSVSQGTEKSNFFASASYLRNEGIVKAKSDFERFTGRLTADTQAKDWLKVGGNIRHTPTTRQIPSTMMARPTLQATFSPQLHR